LKTVRVALILKFRQARDERPSNSIFGSMREFSHNFVNFRPYPAQMRNFLLFSSLNKAIRNEQWQTMSSTLFRRQKIK
jgi:hypothetical protein